jgi:hypothetical protein
MIILEVRALTNVKEAITRVTPGIPATGGFRNG